MTISENPSRDEYTSSPGQTVFNYTFKIYANTDLNVYVTPAGQEADDAADISTDYTVDSNTIGDEAGGFITFNNPLADGDRVTISSNIPYDRTVDYQNNGDFRPDTVNSDNDRQVSQIKQIENGLSRTLQFQESQQGSSNLTMPSGDRTQVFIGFDVDGNPEFIPYADASVPTVIIEDQATLSDGQTTVDFTSGDTRNTGFYVSGDGVDQGRLVVGRDYAVVTDKRIELVDSYPAGSIVLAVQNDPTSQPVVGDVAAFDTVDFAKAQSLAVGELFRTKGYYTAGDGGGATYLVAASQTVDGFGDHVMANGNVMLLQKEFPLSVKQYGAVGDGTTDDTQAILAADQLNTTLFFHDGQFQLSSISIASYVEFSPSGSVGITGSNLAFEKIISAPRTNIFVDATSQRTVDVVVNAEQIIFPEWFDIIAGEQPTKFDDQYKCRQMMRCAGDSQCTVEFGKGTYYLRDLIVDQSNVTVQGQGRDTVISNGNVFNESARYGIMVYAVSPDIVNLNPASGNRAWTQSEQIRNVVFKDFNIKWEPLLGASTDITMNGCGCDSVDNIVIDNIHVNLQGAKRAFYISTFYETFALENAQLINSKCFNSRTGAFISIGDDVTNVSQRFRNISVRDCEFNLFYAPSGAADGQGPSSGIFTHGLSTMPEEDGGVIVCERNIVNGGAYGVDTRQDTEAKSQQSKIVIRNNQFINFQEGGINVGRKNVDIENNYFSSDQLLTGTLYTVAAVLFRPLNANIDLRCNIRSNLFGEMFGAGVTQARHIGAGNVKGVINIIDNEFRLRNKTLTGDTLDFYVAYLGSTAQGQMNFRGNSFESETKQVRVSTSDVNFLLVDLGGNLNMDLQTQLTMHTRLAIPSETFREFNSGEIVRLFNATSGAGDTIGWQCRTGGRPGIWMALRNG